MENAPEGPPRLICRCLGVSSPRVARAVRQSGLDSVAAIGEATRAGTGCRTCHPELCELMAALRGKPLPAGQREAVWRAGAVETERRLEAALFGGIARQLPAGCEVDLVAVHGLSVDLHLHGGSPELRCQIAEALAKRVCPDLEIRFV